MGSWPAPDHPSLLLWSLQSSGCPVASPTTVRGDLPGPSHTARQGGVCGNELRGPLQRAEHSSAKGAHHLQQVCQLHRGALRRGHPPTGEPGQCLLIGPQSPAHHKGA